MERGSDALKPIHPQPGNVSRKNRPIPLQIIVSQQANSNNFQRLNIAPVTTGSVTSSVRLPSGLLDGDRIRVGCGILLGIEIAVFLFMAAGTHGLIVPLPTPTSTDFVSFYAAGSLADAGMPELAYDQAAHYAAEQRAAQVGT